MTPREIFFKFFEAMNVHDIDTAVALLHPDFLEDYPQSGERIRGPQNVKAILENYPGSGGAVEEPRYHGRDEEWLITPAYTVVKVSDAGNAGTGAVRIRYPDGSEWWTVILFEIKDDLIYRQTTFFAQEFEAPEWRAQWVERTDE